MSLAVGGCQATNESRAKPGGDVLFGEKPIERPPIGPTQPPQNRAGMNAPSPPPATASKSNAAMLIGNDPLSGGKQIGIPDPQKSQQQQTLTVGDWQPQGAPTGQGGSLTNGSGGPGVILRQPDAGPIQPVPPPVIRSSSGNAVPVVNANAAVADDQLQAALKSRGVLWQDQKVLADGVHFTCRVPNPHDPNFTRVFEATAGDYRSAVLAVIQQLDAQH
jgi:hypothetical protein